MDDDLAKVVRERVGLERKKRVERFKKVAHQADVFMKMALAEMEDTSTHPLNAVWALQDAKRKIDDAIALREEVAMISDLARAIVHGDE